MLKLPAAVLTIALAGTVAAAGWRDLKIDGSSEAAFQQSLEAFNAELSRERNQVFTAALMDIWLQGTAEAKADQREYTVNDYYTQLNGLSYEEVVTFTDPTGETAKQRYDEAKRTKIANPAQPVVLATPPSIRTRSFHATGGSTAGMAALAMTASTTDPVESSSSSPVTTSTATTCSGIGSSSRRPCIVCAATSARRPESGAR